MLAVTETAQAPWGYPSPPGLGRLPGKGDVLAEPLSEP